MGSVIQHFNGGICHTMTQLFGRVRTTIVADLVSMHTQTEGLGLVALGPQVAHLSAIRACFTSVRARHFTVFKTPTNVAGVGFAYLSGTGFLLLRIPAALLSVGRDGCSMLVFHVVA